jgi:hypothetical protein
MPLQGADHCHQQHIVGLRRATADGQTRNDGAKLRYGLGSGAEAVKCVGLADAVAEVAVLLEGMCQAGQRGNRAATSVSPPRNRPVWLSSGGGQHRRRLRPPRAAARLRA